MACAARPPAGTVLPAVILPSIFLKERLPAQADRRPEALSPDFNQWAIGYEICVRLLDVNLK